MRQDRTRRLYVDILSRARRLSGSRDLPWAWSAVGSCRVWRRRSPVPYAATVGSRRSRRWRRGWREAGCRWGRGWRRCMRCATSLSARATPPHSRPSTPPGPLPPRALSGRRRAARTTARRRSPRWWRSSFWSGTWWCATAAGTWRPRSGRCRWPCSCTRSPSPTPSACTARRGTWAPRISNCWASSSWMWTACRRVSWWGRRTRGWWGILGGLTASAGRGWRRGWPSSCRPSTRRPWVCRARSAPPATPTIIPAWAATSRWWRWAPPSN